jgi:hypothetical protein
MTPQTQESLARMAEALAQLNAALQQELSDLQGSGAPASAVAQLQAGTKAIQDCGQMLLVWSDYIARGDIGQPHDHDDPESIDSIESRPDRYPR